MSMRSILAARLAPALLSTLIGWPIAHAEPGTDAAKPAPDTAAASTTPAAAPSAELAAELSPDVVYAVLVAEVATQRGDHAMAYTHYLHAARLARDPSLAELAARAALMRNDADAARRAADLWVELAPESPQAHQISAYVKLEAGDRDGALAELRQIIAMAPSRAQGYLQAVQLLSRLPDANARVEIMGALVAEGGEDDADAQFALATLAASAGDEAAATRHAERAAALRANWNKPRLLLIRVLLGEERQAEAVTALDGFLAEDPDDQELQMLRAQFHIDAEEYPQALAVFDRMLKSGPGQPDVLFAAAVLAVQIEDLDAARRYLGELRRTGKRNGDAAFLLGQVEELAKNLDLALDWYGKVNGDNATNAQVRIAGIHASRGDLGQAREILQQLRVQFPDDATTLYLIEGELLREQKRPQEASDVYSVALEAQPDNPDLLYARAMLAVGMDRVDLLERDLRRILAADPDHVDALNALGYTLADRTDRFDEAFGYIQRALQLRPDEPAILDSMGWVLYRKGDAAGAEPYLRKALEEVFDAEIAAHLGEVLWQLGRQDEARKVWQRAFDEDPEHEYLLRVLGRYRITHTQN